ncbi:MAG: hypothetical protein SGCHY_002302 [Lobulomycetales sp.]
MSDIATVGTSLLYTLLIDFSIQFVFYVGSSIAKSELLYDASGALTYIACTLAALLWRQDGASLSELSPRQILVAMLLLIWTIRLGTVLFMRILRTGEDKRFEKLKTSPILFAVPWFLQVVWIFLTGFAVWIVLGNPASSQPDFGASDGVGLAIWLFGFLVETIADHQKNVFKNANPTDFVRTGLWKYCRYANYNGEITLWLGMWILCIAGFAEPWQFVSVISPIFVACLIIFVSGIRLLEISSQKKYGHRADFQQYVRTTSKYFLLPPFKDKVE